MIVSTRSSRLFILILTEDDGHAQPVTLQLRANGHEVFVARGEEHAMRILVIHAADVILVDTWLEGEDGYEIANRLSVPMKRRPTLVGVVGRNPEPDRLRTHLFDHRVHKPVDVTALSELLVSSFSRWDIGPRS